MTPAISTTKWSCGYNNESTLILSNKNLSNGWTTLEFWNNGTKTYFCVTDSTGEEAPKQLTETCVETQGRLYLYGIGSTGTMSVLVDNMVWVCLADPDN
jgi:hypothetical protein